MLQLGGSRRKGATSVTMIASRSHQAADPLRGQRRDVIVKPIHMDDTGDALTLASSKHMNSDNGNK